MTYIIMLTILNISNGYILKHKEKIAMLLCIIMQNTVRSLYCIPEAILSLEIILLSFKMDTSSKKCKKPYNQNVMIVTGNYSYFSNLYSCLMFGYLFLSTLLINISYGLAHILKGAYRP